MLQGRLLIISSPQPQSTTALQFSWATAERKQADFKETEATTTLLHTSRNMGRLCRFLLRDAMLAWYIPSCVCVCLSVFHTPVLYQNG